MPRPPADDTAERSVLGAMFLKPELLPILEEILPVETCFWDVRNQVTWKALRLMNRQKRPIDWLTISSEIVRQGDIGRFGGKLKCESYLESITRETPDGLEWEEYAKAVRECWLRRLAIFKMQEVATEIGQPQNDILRLITRLQKDSTVLLTTADYRPPVPIGDLASDLVDNLTERKTEALVKEAGAFRGLSTGWAPVDALCGGMRPGQVIIIGGRPGEGKTSIGLNIADFVAGSTGSRHNGSLERGGAHYVSVEQKPTELAEKIISQHALVDGRALRDGSTTDDDDLRIERTANQLSSSRLFIDDAIGFTFPQIRARALLTKERHGTELLVIDHLQDIKKEDRRQDTTDHLSELMHSIKALGSELGMPIIVLAQLNRGVEQRRARDRKPQKSDLKGAGKIEEVAHMMLLLYPRKELTDPATGNTPTDLLMVKNRTGPEGEVSMLFEKRYDRFIVAQPKENYVDTKAFRGFQPDKDDQAQATGKAQGVPSQTA